MAESTEIFNKLKTFISQELLDGQDSGLDATTPLLEWGVLDSLSMVSLLAFVEEHIGVHVPDKEVKPENFANLESLTKMLTGILKSGETEKVETEKAQTGTMVQVLTTYGVQPELVELPRSDQHILRVSGAKPPWVLLPPLGIPSTSWGEFLRTLINEQEVIAVDLTDFGLSASSNTTPFTFSDHVEETVALLGKATKPPMVLIGSSLGAVLATAIAKQHPEWVKALVIVGFGLVENGPSWWQDYLELSKNVNNFLNQAYYKLPNLPVPLRMVIEYAFVQPVYKAFLDYRGLEALRTTFDGINVPTLFVSGEEDRIVPKSAVEAAAARIPNSRIEWLARCGHFPQMERAQELLLLIQSFLKSI